MPKDLAGARVESMFLRRRNKTRDRLFIRGGKKEWLVKFTAARKLRISRPKPQVFRNLPCTQMVEARNADAGLVGNIVKRGADFLVGARKGHAEVSSRPLGVRDFKVEISIGKKDSAPIFCNERMAMSQFSAERLYFGARTRGYQYQWDFAPIEFRQSFLSLCERPTARVE